MWGFEHAEQFLVIGNGLSVDHSTTCLRDDLPAEGLELSDSRGEFVVANPG